MTVVELGHVSAILVSCSRSCVCQKLFIKSQCVYSFFLRHYGMKIYVVGGHNLFFYYFFICCGFRAVLIVCVKIVCMCKLVKISTEVNSTIQPLSYRHTLVSL